MGKDMGKRIAVVGAGLIGRRHAALIAAASDATLAAIVDPMPAAENVASEFGIPWLSELDALLSSGLADGVILATPNHLHFAQASACLRAGMPCLVEKPITDDLADARALRELAAGTGTPLLVGHHRYYSPAIECARTAIAEGLIGVPVGVSGTAMWFKPADYFQSAAWRTTKGGGPILINMIHEVGNLRHLLGDITAVQATRSSQVRGYEVEETVAMTLSFASGALGSFLLSDAAASPRSWEQTSGEDPAFPHRPEQSAYHIAGTLGALDVPAMTLFHYASGIEPSWRNPFTARQLDWTPADPLERQLAHFIAVIAGEATPRVDAQAGYRNLAVTLAIHQAAQTGRRIEIADDPA